MFFLDESLKAEVQCLFRLRERACQCMNPALMCEEKEYVINKNKQHITSISDTTPGSRYVESRGAGGDAEVLYF